MILDENKEIKIGCCSQRKHFRNIGYNCELGDIITIKPTGLPNKSGIKINVKCDICEKEKQLSYSKYIKNTKNLTEIYCCSEKCAVEKCKRIKFKKYGDENYSNRELAKKTCVERYGIQNVGGLDSSIKKGKQTKLERYGNENYRDVQKYKKTCLKNWGVEFASQSIEFREKVKKTKFELYGDENYNNREQAKETCLKKYGVNHNMKTDDCKEKSKQTCKKNHGVEYPTQSREVFLKGIKTRFKIEKYGDTSLFYQGGYEKYFLEQIEKKSLLTEVSNGKSYDYILNEESHVYHSDFLFRGITIEIKSDWTYNKSGADIDSELENEAKWQAVKDSGDKLVVLWSKKEIKEYVDGLIH